MMFFVLSVCLLSTCTFALSFEPWEIEIILFDMSSHLTKPFQLKKDQRPSVLDYDLYI